MSPLRTFVHNILGTYTPLKNNDGTFVGGLTGQDWEYLVTAILLGLCVYGVMSLLIQFVKSVGRSS